MAGLTDSVNDNDKMQSVRARGKSLSLAKLLSVDKLAPKQVVRADQDTGSASGILQAAVYPPSGPARLKLAYDTLVKTRGEVMVGFGVVSEGGELGPLVRTIIVDLKGVEALRA